MSRVRTLELNNWFFHSSMLGGGAFKVIKFDSQEELNKVEESIKNNILIVLVADGNKWWWMIKARLGRWRHLPESLGGVILFVDATWFYNHLQKKRRQPDGIIRYFCSVISETVKIEDGSIFNLLTVLHFVAWFEVRETLFVGGGKLSQIL